MAAAAQPDAGTLRLQIEQQRAETLPDRAAPIDAPPAAAATVEASTTLQVRNFHFVGNTLLTGDELEAAVAPYLDQSIGFDGLQQAIAATIRAYRDAGWLATAYLPRQEITDGAVTIRIVEATYSGARLEGPDPDRVPASRVLGYLQEPQAPGQPLDLAALDRALLLADDLPGVAVTGALHAGANVSQTGLLVRATDESGSGARVLFDNAGARSTGADRIFAVGQLFSPLRAGDQLDGTFLHSKGNDYLWANYSLPVGYSGWRLNVNGAYLDYELTASEFSALEAGGRSTSIGVGGEYPLIRSRHRNLYLELRAARDAYRNEANAAVQSAYRIHSLSAALTGNAFDPFWGGGSTLVRLALTSGDLGLKGLDPGENPALSGGFDKAELRVTRHQALTGDWSLLATLRAQVGSAELDSSQRFYLGGPQGVRAYPVNEGSGTRGALSSLEVRRRLAHNMTMKSFYDWGHVGNPGLAADYELKGFGLGLSWQGPHRIEIESTVARRHGRHPQPLSTGRDQDGSLDRTRFWLSASLRF